MAFITTHDKWEATHAFINFWLGDKTPYCNNCGENYTACCNNPHPVLIKRTLDDGSETKEAVVLHCKNCDAEIWQCCENPQIGTNKDHTYALIKQNKEMAKNRLRDTASNETKTMRWGISLPPRLYHALDRYFEVSFKEKLFNDKKQMHEFMRKFKQFCIPERV